MAHAPLYGYPAPSFRDKLTEVIDIQGPSSYVNGTGQIIYPSLLGWGGFDAVIGLNSGRISVSSDVYVVALSHSGTYYATFRIPTTVTPGQAAKSVTVKWYVVATGAEVNNATDLDAEYIRALFIGV